MKLKQSPEDFQVEELTDVVPEPEGAFAFYRLEKTGWTTPDALSLVRRRWQVSPGRLSFGGLKDRHARTTQFLTIHRGPQRNLSQQNIVVTYLGQVRQPYGSQSIRGNRFRIVLRSLSEAESERALALVPELRQVGVPNYFDDQRFGSVSGEQFIGKLLVEGKFEQALKLALTAEYEYDRAEQKREKEILTASWGDWSSLKEKLPRGHSRSLVDYLRVHPGDFRGALERLRPELRALYLSAWQSHLWNRMLARFVEQTIPAEHLLRLSLRLGELPFPRGLTVPGLEMLKSARLPLPSARLRRPEGDPGRELARAVLAEEGLTLEQMKVRGSRELFFSRGDRPALIIPADLQAEVSDDERHLGRKKLLLSFELPRGAYATLIVKRIQQADFTPGCA